MLRRFALALALLPFFSAAPAAASKPNVLKPHFKRSPTVRGTLANVVLASSHKLGKWVTNTTGRVIGEMENRHVLPLPAAPFQVKEVDATVDPGSPKRFSLLRSSQPDRADLQQLIKTHNLRTVISLRSETSGDDTLAEGLGLRTFRIPITDNTPPTMAQAHQFLAIVAQEGNRPVMVHCARGVGRTGTMVGIYRIAVNGWTADRAIAEARENGLHMPAQEDFLRKFAGSYRPKPSLAGRLRSLTGLSHL